MYSVAWEDPDLSFDDWPQEFYDEGFDAEEEFGSEELWSFETAGDERVCGRCAPLEGVLFDRDEISENFPFAEEINEDTIQVNLHEPHDEFCRCLLIRQQGTGDLGGEGMVEGRGSPLRPVPGLIRAARSPRAALRYGLRYGLRGALGMIGLSLLVPLLAPLITYAVMPMIQGFINDQVRRQVEAELKRRRDEEERQRDAQFREIYKAGVPE